MDEQSIDLYIDAEIAKIEQHREKLKKHFAKKKKPIEFLKKGDIVYMAIGGGRSEQMFCSYIVKDEGEVQFLTRSKNPKICIRQNKMKLMALVNYRAKDYDYPRDIGFESWRIPPVSGAIQTVHSYNPNAVSAGKIYTDEWIRANVLDKKKVTS